MGYAEGSLWFYAPNKGTPIAFAVFFAISGCVHIYELTRWKCWKVAGLLPWAALLFVAGFILREIGAFHYTNLNIYIASSVLLLCAPPVYEGANYFILGRILYYIPYHSPIHPGRVVSTFVGLDAAVGALTGNGASRFSSDKPSARATGEALLKAALLIQLACMGLYLGIAGRFHHNVRRAGLLTPRLARVLRVLYASCTLITARTIYRTVEYWAAASGVNSATAGGDAASSPNAWSPVLRQEWFFWVFEATLMLSNSVMLNVWHPMSALPRSNKIYLLPDGATEVEGAGFQDPRPFLLTVVDPFDLVGLVRGRDKETKFWETHTTPQQEQGLADGATRTASDDVEAIALQDSRGAGK